MHGRLSAETVENRFFEATAQVLDRDLDTVLTADHDRLVVLVATLGEQVVGDAYYRRSDAGDDAEVAFLIEDAQQGRGLGSIVLGCGRRDRRPVRRAARAAARGLRDPGRRRGGAGRRGPRRSRALRRRGLRPRRLLRAGRPGSRAGGRPLVAGPANDGRRSRTDDPRAAHRPVAVGPRGGPAADLTAVEDLLMRLGRLGADLPQIASLRLDVACTTDDCEVVRATAAVTAPPSEDTPRRLDAHDSTTDERKGRAQ
jgi:hypothetical protein